MPYLLIVSLIWAFSFGLIETYLSVLDPNVVAWLRLTLALFVFLPFLRPRRVSPGLAGKLMACGALQYGVMYASYIAAYGYLHAYEVALFTVFTPLLVTLLNDALEARLHWRALGCALLAVIGTGIVVYGGLDSAALWRGFGLVMLANACFAFGQVWYRKLIAEPGLNRDLSVFAWLYAGAAGVTGLLALAGEGQAALPATYDQWAVLAYLGVIASGAGFFLWNAGARLVNAGSLAVFNNLKVPLAIAVALLIFGEQTHLARLIAGGAVVLIALWLNEREADPGLDPAFRVPSPESRVPHKNGPPRT